MKKFRNLSKAKKVLVIAVTLAVLATAFVFVYKSFNDKKDNSTGADTGINYNPPTEEEKNQAEDNKAEVDKRAELDKQSSQPQSTQKKQVPVVITSATVNGIYSYITGVFEDGGTCTATITQGSKKIVKTSSAFKDVNKTSCTPIILSRSDFPTGGMWSAKVDYNSSSSEGQSQSVNMEVQ